MLEFLVEENNGEVTLLPQKSKDDTEKRDYFEDYINGLERSEVIIQIIGNNRKVEYSGADKQVIRIRYLDFTTKHRNRGNNIESIIAVNTGVMITRIVYAKNKPVTRYPDRRMYEKVWKPKGTIIFQATINALKIYRGHQDILPFPKTFIETYSDEAGLLEKFQHEFGFTPFTQTRN